jgi:signal peptidase II
MEKKIGRNAVLIVFLVLALDQLIKIMVKTHMMEGQEILVAGNWFRLHFVENSGMAFSMELPSAYGKILLSTFRLIAIGFIIYLIRRLIAEKYHQGLVYAGAMILAGAIGNMIDSTFYGLVFTDSIGRVAATFPKGGGYAGFLKGNVVDMLWFPIAHGVFPQWVPFWGGEYYEFFRPVFNIADAAITIGVAIIIVFQKTFFTQPAAPIENTVVEPEVNTSTETELHSTEDTPSTSIETAQ